MALSGAVPVIRWQPRAPRAIDVNSVFVPTPNLRPHSLLWAGARPAALERTRSPFSGQINQGEAPLQIQSRIDSLSAVELFAAMEPDRTLAYSALFARSFGATLLRVDA